jgi:hypothetical protein
VNGIRAAERLPELVPELAAQVPEVVLRAGVRYQDGAAPERFSKEIAPLVLNSSLSVN